MSAPEVRDPPAREGAHGSTPLRLVIVSTPRCGNTWFRHLLGEAYGIPSIAVHNPADLVWETLPAECVLQLHWHPLPSFLERLERYGFRSVALARHPLDVLISVLQFALHEPTSRWLEGEEGNERAIYGAMPRSAAFVDYATGKRATALLAVSREWWTLPGCVQVHYEELVRDPRGEMQRLGDLIGVPLRKTPEQAVEANTIPKLRAKFAENARHFWQGKAGLWRTLLTVTEAERIAAAHADIFATLGYVCDPDPTLSEIQADTNWLKLVWADLAEGLHTLRQTQRDKEKSEAKLVAVEESLAAIKQELDRTRIERDSRQQALDTVAAQRSHFEALGQQTLQQMTALRAELVGLQQAAVQEAEALRHQAGQIEQARQIEQQARLADQQAHQAQTSALQQAHQTQLDGLCQSHQTELNVLRESHEAQVEEAHHTERRLRAELRALQDSYRDVVTALEEAQGRLEDAQSRLEDAQGRLLQYDGVGGYGLRVARKLGRMSRSHPKMSGVVKKILRLAG
jgi:hypothetical protein